LLDASSEGSGVDGGEAVQLGLDLAEVAPQTVRVDEPRADKCAQVCAVAGVVAFELGQRLRVGIEVTKRQPAAAFDGRASLLPPLGQWNEIARGSELDVDLQLVLEPGNCP